MAFRCMGNEMFKSESQFCYYFAQILIDVVVAYCALQQYNCFNTIMIIVDIFVLF